MDQNTVVEVVVKLIGPIEPIGETKEDERRLENLKTMTEVVDKLLFKIDQVSEYQNRSEHSMSQAGGFAKRFFNQLGIKE